MAKAIPNPEPPRFGAQSSLDTVRPNSTPPQGVDPWGNADALADKGGANNDEIVQLQAENQELRTIITELQGELEAASGKQENDWTERQKDYERMLDEKTELIRSLHVQIDEMQNQIRPPTPKEEELFAMSEELERERAQLQQERRKIEEEARQLKEDEEVMTEEMRKMEIQMARERADMARQRTELQRISEEIRQELDRIERDRGLSDKLVQLRQRHTDVLRGKAAPQSQLSKSNQGVAPAPKPHAPTQMAIDLDAEQAGGKKQPPADKNKQQQSGVFRKFFGSGG
jgi:chromosome segregation ATPase